MTLRNLTVTCPICHYEWSVIRGNIILPYTKYTKCPKCGHEKEWAWYDDETTKKLTQKQLGLLPDYNKTSEQIIVLQKEIETLKASKNADRKEIEALNAIIEATRKEVQILRELVDSVIKKDLESVKEESLEQRTDITHLQEQFNSLSHEFDLMKKGK